MNATEHLSAYDSHGNYLIRLKTTGLYVAAHKGSGKAGRAASAYTAMELAGFSSDECHDMWRLWISNHY